MQILEGSDVSQFTDEELKGYQTLAGVYNSEEQTQITLVYKKYNDDGTNIIDEENSFLIKSLYAQNMEAVINAMYLLKDFNKISDFNVVRKNSWFDKNQTEKQTGDRIVRQASGYKYEYDKENQTGVLTVEYADFQYKDVMVTMQSNDAESHLTKDFYTANDTQTSEEIKLVFSYDDLEMWGKNNCDWLFGLNADNFSIVNNASDKVSIVNDGTARTLTVTCAPEDVNALDQVSITAVSEIVEDVPYQMTYNYKKIIDTAGTLSEETLQSDTVTLMYSELVSMSYENFITLYGGVVNDELLPATLAGTNYCKAIGFEKSYNTENLTCNITVTYEYGLIFKVTDNRTADWYKFLPKSDTTLLYKGDYFYDHGYDGCRVQKITTTLDETKIRITPAYTYKEITVELLATQFTDGIIPVCLNFTDKWLIEINYMEQYKDTPFAVKTKYSGEIRVSDFEDIYALTVSDLATILNKASMSIIRDRATVDTITVTYNEDTESYTVDTTYSLMSMVQIDYEGNRKEIKVPLTCYKDWCEDYGMDWTILYLNYSGNGK
ncbi:MAG: hypothetical protein ACI4RO_05655, partial [Candidatus Scatosoma sp.]